MHKIKNNFINELLESFSKASEDLSGILNSDFLNGLLTYETLSKKMMRSGGLSSENIYKGFKNMEGRGLIKQINGEWEFKFTNKGKDWYNRSALRYFKIQSGKWDGKWRVIIFDIPEEFKKKREILRRRLINIGFHALQKSVLVFPYPCKKELGDMCSRIGIGDYVDVLVAESVGFKEKELKDKFGL